MVDLNSRQRQTHHAQQRFHLIARLDQANLLEMTEEDFHRLITEIEKSPLFEKLQRQQRIIRYTQVPGIDVSSRFYQLKPEIAADQGSLDTESLMLNKEYIVRRIQELGLENFKRYLAFLQKGGTRTH
ncbi:MAG: hypothetical protein SVM79_05440 [Chloroflexota bacterium]|nr:hypothetical protein [Chloroflexota bacterium]